MSEEEVKAKAMKEDATRYETKEQVVKHQRNPSPKKHAYKRVS